MHCGLSAEVAPVCNGTMAEAARRLVRLHGCWAMHPLARNNLNRDREAPAITGLDANVARKSPPDPGRSSALHTTRIHLWGDMRGVWQGPFRDPALP